MPDYTDLNGNGFADNIRGWSNNLRQAYNDSRDLKIQREADADIATTIAFHQDFIRSTASRLLDLYETFGTVRNEWFARLNDAKTQNIATDIPQNETDVMAGSTGSGRQAIVANDVHRFFELTDDYVKWFNDGVFDGPGTGDPATQKNQLVICGQTTGNIVLTESDVVVLIDDICVKLRNEYDATSGLKLSWVVSTATLNLTFGG